MEIWNYTLSGTHKETIMMPAGSKVLHLDTQNGMPHIWVQVDPTREKERYIFGTYATGKTLRDEKGLAKKYVGTFLIDGGRVYHVYQYLPHKRSVIDDFESGIKLATHNRIRGIDITIHEMEHFHATAKSGDYKDGIRSVIDHIKKFRDRIEAYDYLPEIKSKRYY